VFPVEPAASLAVEFNTQLLAVRKAGLPPLLWEFKSASGKDGGNFV
jgi:hypothetical protein